MRLQLDRAADRAEPAAFFGHSNVLQCARPIAAIQIAGTTAR